MASSAICLVVIAEDVAQDEVVVAADGRGDRAVAGRRFGHLTLGRLEGGRAVLGMLHGDEVAAMLHLRILCGGGAVGHRMRRHAEGLEHVLDLDSPVL